MKKIVAVMAMMIAVAGMGYTASAQVNAQVNINSQPDWGPVGYDYVQSYYFPDYNFYYDVIRGKYIVLNNNQWVYTTIAPAGMGFDPYRAYKVVVNEKRPYNYNQKHRREYARYKGQGPQQPMIRDSRDEKYKNRQQVTYRAPRRNSRAQDEKGKNGNTPTNNEGHSPANNGIGNDRNSNRVETGARR